MKTIETIRLIRHGLSKGNTGEIDFDEVPDCNIPLTKTGIEQALVRGEQLSQELDLMEALIYYSPYLRTRQTLFFLLKGAGLKASRDRNPGPGFVRVFEDSRLRELERGYSASDWQQELRKKHRWFFYRFQNGGESPADAFDRASAFKDSQFRQAERKGLAHHVLVTHGTFMNASVARFMHLTVEEFCNLDTPDNCGVIQIERVQSHKEYDYRNGQWGVSGLKFRSEERKVVKSTDPLIWDSDDPWEIS